ncbi:MAG TPA: universal stress protein [Anaerolineae bacterium]
MNPISIALAFPFLGSVRTILRRSTSVSPRAAQQIRRPELAPNGHRIIVPVLESALSMQAVEVACQLASEQQATIMLACVIQVHETLGLDMLLPGAQERAKRLVRQAESIVLQHGLQAESCVVQHRNAEDAILELACKLSAKTIVVGMSNASGWPNSQIGKTVSGLFQHAPCRVVIAKAPLAA